MCVPTPHTSETTAPPNLQTNALHFNPFNSQLFASFNLIIPLLRSFLFPLSKSTTYILICVPISNTHSLRFSIMLLQQLSVLALLLLCPVWADNFYQDATVTFGDHRTQIQDGGRLLALSLDKISGSGFQSKNAYLFGRFDMQLKLVPGNSAGTVTTFYLSSQGAGHDEIDFEFLGNSSGQPYTVHTNVYSQGKGNKEQQFRLWFDPTSSFHTYSIVWNSQRIIFLVDNIPIRVFNNHEAIGVAFPKNQAMRVYASLWNADEWATQGGRVKTDWSMAPFTASYRNFNTNACVWSAALSTLSCEGSKTDSVNNDQAWQTQELNGNDRNRLRWVQQKYMIYNYCADAKRFSQGLSPECKRSRF